MQGAQCKQLSKRLAETDRTKVSYISKDARDSFEKDYSNCSRRRRGFSDLIHLKETIQIVPEGEGDFPT